MVINHIAYILVTVNLHFQQANYNGIVGVAFEKNVSKYVMSSVSKIYIILFVRSLYSISTLTPTSFNVRTFFGAAYEIKSLSQSTY